MQRTITVKGSGNVKVKPDQVVLFFSLKAKNADYDRAMEQADRQVSALKEALAKKAFCKDSVKTKSFDISTVYDSVRDRNGNYNRVFGGYQCEHELKLSFDFDTKRLSEALNAAMESGVNPQINIDFTVKDPSAVNEMILQNAAENARRKAEILCAASGVKLGTLAAIDYNWGEVSFVSRTRYMLEDSAVEACGYAADIDIEPDDIDAADTVTFVWEIE